MSRLIRNRILGTGLFHNNHVVLSTVQVQVQVQVLATCTVTVEVAGLGLGMHLLYRGPRGIPETLVFRSRRRLMRRCKCVVFSFAPYVTIILSWL